MDRKSTKKQIKQAKEQAKQGDNSELEDINWAWRFTNQRILSLTKTPTMSDFIERQNCRWIAHMCRSSNLCLTKQLMFNEESCTRRGNRPPTVYENVIRIQQVKYGKSAETFLKESFNKR